MTNPGSNYDQYPASAHKRQAPNEKNFSAGRKTEFFGQAAKGRTSLQAAF
jgi:hypothetical protein